MRGPDKITWKVNVDGKERGLRTKPWGPPVLRDWEKRDQQERLREGNLC